MDIKEDYDRTGIFATREEIQEITDMQWSLHKKVRDLALTHGLAEQEPKLLEKPYCEHLRESCYGIDLSNGEFINPKNWRNLR